MRLFPATIAALALCTTAASAQTAPAPPPPPLAVANPSYTTLVLELDVARPAAQVWARVGKYCAIGEWFGVTCAITSTGDADRLGAVRLLNGVTIEMLVAKTALSYTYTQPVRAGVPYNAYHGTLEVQPVTATTSKLVYSFFYDVSMLADDAARAAERTNRTNRFMGGMRNMKILAEGGTLPPPAPAAPPAR
jgi:hypothetical protein